MFCPEVCPFGGFRSYIPPMSQTTRAPFASWRRTRLLRVPRSGSYATWTTLNQGLRATRAGVTQTNPILCARKAILWRNVRKLAELLQFVTEAFTRPIYRQHFTAEYGPSREHLLDVPEAYCGHPLRWRGNQSKGCQRQNRLAFYISCLFQDAYPPCVLLHSVLLLALYSIYWAVLCCRHQRNNR